ncbi:hypothetical protein COOONC_00398 [Cooperia oncophora]
MVVNFKKRFYDRLLACVSFLIKGFSYALHFHQKREDAGEIHGSVAIISLERINEMLCLSRKTSSRSSKKKKEWWCGLVKQALLPSLVFSQCIMDGYEVLVVDLYNTDSSFRVILVYRVPSCNSEKTRKMTKCVSDLPSSQASCLLMGDFNFLDLAWFPKPCGHCGKSQVFLTMLLNHEYFQFVDFCTGIVAFLISFFAMTNPLFAIRS